MRASNATAAAPATNAARADPEAARETTSPASTAPSTCAGYGSHSGSTFSSHALWRMKKNAPMTASAHVAIHTGLIAVM